MSMASRVERRASERRALGCGVWGEGEVEGDGVDGVARRVSGVERRASGSRQHGRRASGVGGEGEGEGRGRRSSVAEGEPPDLATQVDLRASGARASTRTQDDGGRGATSGERTMEEEVRRRARARRRVRASARASGARIWYRAILSFRRACD